VTLYNVTAEVGGRSPEDPRPSGDEWEAVEAKLPEPLWSEGLSLHSSEHHDDGVAITMTVEAETLTEAAETVVSILASLDVWVDAFEVMTTEDFDRRTDRIAPSS
jgi:hypothetical protein